MYAPRHDALAATSRSQAGFSMIEVLVALVILMVGLLGLAGLMSQTQRAQLESYQRVQALILAKDMVARINANRVVAINQPACYAITTTPATGTPYLGTNGIAPPACAAAAPVTTAQAQRATQDLTEWNNLLLGATENMGGTNTGGMVGARGCISYNSTSPQSQGGPLIDLKGLPITGTGVYTVEVTWQGVDAFAPIALNCAKGTYGADTMRRDLNLNFRIGSINNAQQPHSYP